MTIFIIYCDLHIFTSTPLPDTDLHPPHIDIYLPSPPDINIYLLSNTDLYPFPLHCTLPLTPPPH